MVPHPPYVHVNLASFRPWARTHAHPKRQTTASPWTPLTESYPIAQIPLRMKGTENARKRLLRVCDIVVVVVVVAFHVDTVLFWFHLPFLHQFFHSHSTTFSPSLSLSLSSHSYGNNNQQVISSPLSPFSCGRPPYSSLSPVFPPVHTQQKMWN